MANLWTTRYRPDSRMCRKKSDYGDMNLVGFQKLRSGFQVNATPASPGVLADFERQLRRQLERSVTFDHVEVEISADPDRLLVGLVSYDPALSESEVAWSLEHVWSRLEFEHWEAHAFLVEDGHVELQAGTLDGRNQYVTLHLVAQAVAATAPAVPAQRAADDAGAGHGRPASRLRRLLGAG